MLHIRPIYLLFPSFQGQGSSGPLDRVTLSRLPTGFFVFFGGAFMTIIGRGIYLQLAILPLLEVDLWILGNLERDTEK